jgi:hypothetical protein
MKTIRQTHQNQFRLQVQGSHAILSMMPAQIRGRKNWMQKMPQESNQVSGNSNEDQYQAGVSVFLECEAVVLSVRRSLIQ